MITAQAINERLHLLLADYTNRGYKPREAVSAALRALADWASVEGHLGAVHVGEEDFERLVAQVEQMIARFRTEQQHGAVPVGGGVYADVVSDEEYAERVGRKT